MLSGFSWVSVLVPLCRVFGGRQAGRGVLCLLLSGEVGMLFPNSVALWRNDSLRREWKGVKTAPFPSLTDTTWYGSLAFGFSIIVQLPGQLWLLSLQPCLKMV